MMRAIVILSALGLLFAGGLAAFGGPSVVVADAIHGGTTAVGPSVPLHEQVTCDTTAGGVQIKPVGSYQLVSYECETAGDVFIGNVTGAGSALTTANGRAFTTGESFGANVSEPERCISAGSVALSCRFLVTRR